MFRRFWTRTKQTFDGRAAAGSTEQPEKQFCVHRDPPRRVIAPMRHNERLAARVGLSLGAGSGKIEILDALDLDMQLRERGARHVGTVRAA